MTTARFTRRPPVPRRKASTGTPWRAGMLTLALAWSGLTAHAQTVCGMPQGGASSPSDLAHAVSDLSLAHYADQPAGVVTCSMGYLAAKCGDFALANRIFDKCIAQGYVGAMLWKGLMYEDGSGVPRDPARATAMFKRAAESGNEHYATLGKLHYASALHEGHGVPRDTAAARRWFEQAAAEGSEEAQTFLRTGRHTGSRDRRGESFSGGPAQDSGQRLVRQWAADLAEQPAWQAWLQELDVPD